MGFKQVEVFLCKYRSRVFLSRFEQVRGKAAVENPRRLDCLKRRILDAGRKYLPQDMLEVYARKPASAEHELDKRGCLRQRAAGKTRPIGENDRWLLLE